MEVLKASFPRKTTNKATKQAPEYSEQINRPTGGRFMGDNKEGVTGHLGVHKGELIAAHEFLIIRREGTVTF